jgi:hypothetical protein
VGLRRRLGRAWRGLRSGVGWGANQFRHEMFTVIGDLLRRDPLPARVRAFLYRVAARIPGIQALGPTLYGERDELLFDPRTASLLGETSVVVKPGPKYHVKPGWLSGAVPVSLCARPRWPLTFRPNPSTVLQR